MNFGDVELRERQRRSVLQPRVARHELPWEKGKHGANPNGVASVPAIGGSNPFRVETLRWMRSQGRLVPRNPGLDDETPLAFSQTNLQSA